MKKLRQSIGTFARLALAVVVLVWLLRKMGVSKLIDTSRALADQWPLVALAALLTAVPLTFCAVRWKAILGAQGMSLPWAKVGRIFMIGQFFNAFMIGPTGGDIVKAYYVARETSHKKTEAVTSVFVDRVIGLIVLALLVGAVILARWDFYAAHAATRMPARWALLACGILVAGAVAVLSVHWFEVWPALRRWQTRPLIGGALAIAERAYNSFYVCRRHPRLLLAMAIYSLVTQLSLVVIGAVVGRALGLPLGFSDYLAITPLVGFISAIPVTPGAVGIREGLNIHLMSALAVSADKAFIVAFLPFCFLTVWGLPGGVLFLFQGGHGGPTLDEGIKAMEADEAGTSAQAGTRGGTSA